MGRMKDIFIKVQNGELLTNDEAVVARQSGFTVKKVVNTFNGKSTIMRRIAQKLELDYLDLSLAEFTEDLYLAL